MWRFSNILAIRAIWDTCGSFWNRAMLFAHFHGFNCVAFVAKQLDESLLAQ